MRWRRNDFGNSYHQLASVQGNIWAGEYTSYSLITGIMLRPWITFVLFVREMWIFHTLTLQWRYNGRDGVSNHQTHDCLLNRLFRRRSNKTSKLRVTGLCAGNSPATGEFPAQMASNAENIYIWWRHHELWLLKLQDQYPKRSKSNRTNKLDVHRHIRLSLTPLSMMTSSNGTFFRINGHLCGEFSGHRWIPRTKASDAKLWWFLWSAPE